MKIKNIYFKAQFWHIVIYHKWVKHIFLSKDVVSCEHFHTSNTVIGKFAVITEDMRLNPNSHYYTFYLLVYSCHELSLLSYKLSSHSSFLCFFLDFYFHAHEKRGCILSLDLIPPTLIIRSPLYVYLKIRTMWIHRRDMTAWGNIVKMHSFWQPEHIVFMNDPEFL